MDQRLPAKNIWFGSNQLKQLITNLHTLTGIWANIFDSSGLDIQIRNTHSDFCHAINAIPDGHRRCVDCDVKAVQACHNAGGGLYAYRCHAGLSEFLLPIYEGGQPIAYLVFGQLLDDSSVLTQWENAKELLDWYPGGAAALRESFFRLKQCSDEEITAFAEILEALASYIQLEGIIRSAEYTDAQKLEMYLDEHYMEPLTLPRISADLHMGTTKLCALAKQLSSGSTITQMISQRRIKAAQKLLLSGDLPISSIAEQVGFSDYNYFTRIFKSITGVSPRDFRKAHFSQR
ncbi:MAG: helix-turn-helix domain-containing protein [Ruminococcaceae bacterium]|nr:helix-turn-helix domain-containing protein [Oscillospiraceae bacterium]